MLAVVATGNTTQCTIINLFIFVMNNNYDHKTPVAPTNYSISEKEQAFAPSLIYVDG